MLNDQEIKDFVLDVLQFRARNRMTQTDLAKLSGLSIGSIVRLEKMNKVRGTTIAKVELAMKWHEKNGEDNIE